MKFVCLAVVVSFTFVTMMNAGYAAVRIAGDRGGRIGRYLDKYNAIRASGESVVIDGERLSACTLVLGVVPQDKICVTPRASLGFHDAYNLKGRARVPHAEATQLLYSTYAPPVRSWIATHGGLKPHMIVLRGKELASIYRPCHLNVRSFSPR